MIFNALVLPGSGHILIGERARGYCLSGITLLLVLVPMMSYMIAFYRALSARSLDVGAKIYGTSALSAAWAANSILILICIAGILLMWIYGIVDLVIRNRRQR